MYFTDVNQLQFLNTDDLFSPHYYFKDSCLKYKMGQVCTTKMDHISTVLCYFGPQYVQAITANL